MPALLSAELIKITTTRTGWGLMLGATAVAMLGAFSTIVSGDPADLGRPLHELNLFLLASINLALFAAVLGIRGVTDEFRHGSIIPTLLITPSRRRVLAAKALAYAAAGAVLTAVAQAAMVALAILLLRGKGVDATVGTADFAAMGGLALAGALWAVIGVAVGTLMRHQVAAVVGALVWVLVVENLGAGLLGTAGGYLPGQAGHALAAAPAQDLLVPTAGALILGGYALAGMLAATVRIVRSDIAAA